MMPTGKMLSDFDYNSNYLRSTSTGQKESSLLLSLSKPDLNSNIRILSILNDPIGSVNEARMERLGSDLSLQS